MSAMHDLTQSKRCCEAMIKGLLLLICLFFITVTEAANTVKEVKIEVSGGVKLSGQYFPTPKPGPAVLLLHMCDPSTNKSEWFNLAKMLQDVGIKVLTFDYRGFGNSEGKRPTHLKTVDVAMAYWRRHWSADVELAYRYLVSQKGVNEDLIGIGGASCGVFMGMDFTLSHPNVKTFVSLGGPVDQVQYDQLAKKKALPILIISGNEGPSLQWSDNIFNASTHPDTQISKFRIVTHGTQIFQHLPKLQNRVANWFKDKLR